MSFLYGITAGILFCWAASIWIGWWATRHRHRWHVILTSGASWSDARFAYVGLLDRCGCGRMRWRPDVPVPPWWPMSDLMKLHNELDAEHLDVWLNAMPRFRQRHERALVRRELKWANESEQTTEAAA